MSDPFQSSIQQLRNSALNNIRILTKKIHDCYRPLVKSEISTFFSNLCDDFLQSYASSIHFRVQSVDFMGWLSFEKDLYRLSNQSINESTLKQLNELLNGMLSYFFTYITSFQNHLLNVEKAENARIRLMFIAELFTVALREIQGHVYHKNLPRDLNICHPYTVRALKEMYGIEPSDTADLDEYRKAECFEDEYLKKMAYVWKVLPTKYSRLPSGAKVDFLETMRKNLYDLFRICLGISNNYNLDLPKLLDYLLEKKSRNKTVHYEKAIGKYAQKVNFNTFSLEDFIKIPENNHIDSAMSGEKQKLEKIFEGICSLTKQFRYKVIWPRDRITVDSQRDPQGNFSAQAFDAFYIRDDYPYCWIRRVEPSKDERILLDYVFLIREH